MRVMNTQCQTCIYRSDSPLDLKELEAEVTDPHMAGFFSGYRTCHHSHAGSDACCRGFWDRHKWKFTGGPDCSAAWFCGVQRKKRRRPVRWGHVARELGVTLPALRAVIETERRRE